MANNFEADYTFESFVTTPHNELAFEAAKAAVEEPGTKYNPFFFYGGLGSGKTHLLHAIGNAMHKEHKDGKLLCVRGERFSSDVIYALKEHCLTRFYQRYQDCDFLMIDDFGGLDGEDAAQSAAVRLFDALWRKKKQVVIASELSFGSFPVIEAYFRLSCDTGLVCDILAPEGLVKNGALL